MKINILCELIKIKHNNILLLIRFYRIENIKSRTMFNSIVNALDRREYY